MAHEVIMPALGMAQDTGLLVSWLKAPGEQVTEGEALFEVETDKATLEVEAQVSGYLSSVTAQAGAEIPVGHVIAQIVAVKDQVQMAAVPMPAEKPQPVAVAAPVVVPAPQPAPKIGVAAPPAPKAASQPDPSGRILASPLARRMAQERGLDLARLARSGVPQPFHVADLDKLKATTNSVSVLTAAVDHTAFEALLARSGQQAERGRLLAAFAVGAWRVTFGGDEPAIKLHSLDASTQRQGPPDATEVNLFDLSATRLSGYIPQTGDLTLTVARGAAGLTLTLAFNVADLALPDAIAWLDEVAARLQDPIRQLI